MKKLYIIPQMLLGAAALLSACSQDELVDTPNNGNTHTIELNLTANCPTFDQAQGTRAEGKAWKEGDKLRLTFVGDNITTYGTATYSAGSNKWVLQYSGNIANTQNGKLVAYYFESPESETNTSVILNGKSPIYCDSTGIFTFDGATLNATASLTPANSRMRLQGHPGDTLYVSGVAMTYSYNADHSFTDDYWNYHPFIISKEADSEGNFYTDYFYLSTENQRNRSNLKIVVMNNKHAYKHNIPDLYSLKGESGYLTMPGTEGANNWLDCNPFANLQFPDSISSDRREIIMKYLDEMVKVDGGDLTLGSQTSTDGQALVHMYPFYIMKTQVSNELFEAVMGYMPPTPFLTSDIESKGLYTLAIGTRMIPSGKSDYEVGLDEIFEKFYYKMCKITGLNFDIPYESEWEYAARGGQKSEHYTHIAGITTNATSWGVKYTNYPFYQMQVHAGISNELGLLGLCSNASDACRFFGSAYKGSTEFGSYMFILKKFRFTPTERTEGNLVKIIWRGPSNMDSFISLSYALPSRSSHYAFNDNKARGLRLVLRYQDNF